MSLFTINPETCVLDGLCAKECPAGCIVFEPGQLPVPHEKKFAYCLECGHCMAVCPTGAFQLNKFSDQGVEIDRDLKLSPEQAVQFLSSRRSVRAFKNELVDHDTLTELLDVTQYAPSGHNARSVRWSVAATPEKVREIAETVVKWMRSEVEGETPLAERLHLPGLVKAWDNGVDMICRNAPALAVAYGVEKGVTPMEDGVNAISYLELAATGVGLGACWCGYALLAARYDRAVCLALGIPKEQTAYGALMLGKPKRRYRYIPPRPHAEINWL